MDFEWHAGKARANLFRHGVDFADATAVFFDPGALTTADEHPDEERYATIGSDMLNRVLIVIYCWRGDRIRIISARRATRSERAAYEGGHEEGV